MANSQNTTSPSRFHNFSNGALADEIGRVDAISKAADAELKALKDEFKARGLTEMAGDAFTVTATEQIAGRLDTKAVREFLERRIFRLNRRDSGEADFVIHFREEVICDAESLFARSA